jgi:hypothetical protein
MNPYFQNTRPAGEPSEHLAISFAAHRGTLVGYGATEGSGALASGTNFVGHLVRRVNATGPELADHVYGHDTGSDTWAQPEKIGNTVSVELSNEFIVNDEFLVVTGTGAIASGVAVGAKLEVFEGKLRLAQGTGTPDALFAVAEQLVTDAENTGETLRLRIRKVGA